MDQLKLIEIRVKLMALAERIKAKGNHSDELQTVLEANLALRTLEKDYNKAVAQAHRKQMQWAELSLHNNQLKKQVKALTENVQL